MKVGHYKIAVSGVLPWVHTAQAAIAAKEYTANIEFEVLYQSHIM